jgi:hypothetical protein
MRRSAELVAMLVIGDGVITLPAPSRHSLLWRFGPEGNRRAMEAFAERPALTRSLAVAEIVGGLWLVLRQYGEE